MEEKEKKVEIKADVPLMIKEEAELVYNNLGIDMDTAINIFLRETARQKEIPFDIYAHPSKKLLDALEEGEQIIKEIKSGKRKGYTNMKDLIDSLNDED